MINRAAEKLLDLSTWHVRGRLYSEVFGTHSLVPLRALIDRVHEARGGSVREQIDVMVNGRNLTLTTNVRVLESSDGEYLGLVSVFDDHTALISAQRTAAWREVARRIAHEIKNPLTPIQLSAQRLRKKHRERSGDFDHVLEDCTAIIVEQVEGIRKLVNEFSRFARLPEVRPVPWDLNRILDDTIALYKSSHPSIAIETAYDPALPLVEVDREQIQRVFINLFENSVEAMDGGGRIQVSTALKADLEVAEIQVRDEGYGIPSEDRDKVFLPYFSTKEDGTGLGLAIASKIVSDHGGCITVASNVPRGTVMTVELPLKAQPAVLGA